MRDRVQGWKQTHTHARKAHLVAICAATDTIDHGLGQLITEVVIATKESNSKTRAFAYDTLVSIAKDLKEAEQGSTGDKVGGDDNDDDAPMVSGRLQRFLALVCAGRNERTNERTSWGLAMTMMSTDILELFIDRCICLSITQSADVMSCLYAHMHYLPPRSPLGRHRLPRASREQRRHHGRRPPFVRVSGRLFVRRSQAPPVCGADSAALQLSRVGQGIARTAQGSREPKQPGEPPSHPPVADASPCALLG